jgi:hypothetical protein
MKDDKSSPNELSNATRCPHEKDWYCQLLKIDCHPGIKGCILSGQPLIDALLAYEQKQNVIKKETGRGGDEERGRK